MQAGVYLFAQEFLGVRNGHYAGIQAALLNPAGIEGQSLKWDVNVASVGVLFDNNYLYIPKGDVPVLGFGAILKGIKHENKFVTKFDAASPDKHYHFVLASEILGPSFQAEIADRQVIGFTFAARAYANISDFTGHVAQNAYDYMRNKDLWDRSLHDNSTRLNGMAWLEYGLHYAAILSKDDRGELAVGVGLKYLEGIGAAYVKNTNLNYMIGDTTQLIFTNSNLDYGRTEYDTYRRGHRQLNHGHGFGADLGVTYTRYNEGVTAAASGSAASGSGTPGSVAAGDGTSGSVTAGKWTGRGTSNYIYKLGFSLIDVGRIRFNRHTSLFHLQSDSANFANWSAYDLKTNNQVDRTISAAFYQGDSTKSLAGSSFKMGLPAAISVQADWNCYGNFFVNATIVKGFGHGNRQGVVRPDVYSLTPRYESRWVDVSIPFSVIYYGRWRPRLGFAFRAGYFFFGGDAPAGLFKLRNMYGVDFYAGVHFFSKR